MAFKITKNTHDEAAALVAGGDINLSERRTTYARIKGRNTVLNDDQVMVAAMTEDDDDEEFANNVDKIEAEGYEIVADEKADAE